VGVPGIRGGTELASGEEGLSWEKGVPGNNMRGKPGPSGG